MAEDLDTADESEFFSESHEEATKRILRENAPFAATAIVEIALNSLNENTKLRAATYVVDKVLNSTDASADPLEQFLTELSKEANAGH